MDRFPHHSATLLQNSLAFLFFFTAIFLLYSNTLQSPFTFDDAQIVENYYIRIHDLSWESFKQVSTLSPNKKRLLPNISFALNYYFDGFNVLGFHLVNIFIHAAVTFVFFLLARTTLLLHSAKQHLGRVNEIALAAALLWAIHPLQTNGVTYIVQRMTSMATLFCLLSLYCYIKARVSRNGGRKILLYSLSLLLGISALFSKENSGMLPLFILGYEAYFIIPLGNEKKDLQKTILAAGTLLLLFLIICFLFLGSSPLKNILAGYGMRDFTPGQRLLTESRVVVHYISLLLLPLPARLNLGYDFPLSTGVLAPPQTLLALLVLTALVLLIFKLSLHHKLKSFALFWFLGNLLVESTIIPLELIFEHRMYMPSMFLVLLFTHWLYKLFPKKTLARGFIVLLLISLAVLTWQRNSAWQSEISIWSDVVKKSPGLTRAYGNLAKAYGDKGDHKTAQDLLEMALKIAPGDSRTLVSLGAAAQNQNRLPEALDFYSRALAQQGPDQDKIHRNLANLYLQLQRYNEAVKHALEAYRLAPYNYNSFISLAAVYFKSGNLKLAEQTLTEALRLFPDKGDIYVQLAAVYEHQNKLREATEIINKALTLNDVNRAQAYNTLGIIYWRLQDYPRSATAAQQALEIDPQLLDAYLTLGITYEDMGRQDLALEQFIRGWQQGLDIVTVFNDWAINFLNMKQAEKALYYLQESIKLEPARPESHEHLATLYQAINMPIEAKKERELASKLRNH